MKKLLLLFIPLMFFFGCEEEENIPDECLLYGTWSLDYYESVETGYTICTCGFDADNCDLLMTQCAPITLSEDGGLNANTLGGIDRVGEWSGGCQVNDEIIFNWFDQLQEEYTIIILSISNNSLLMQSSDGYINHLTKID